MRTSDFHFDLPEGLIAQEPARPRDASRLLALDRTSGRVTDHTFTDLPDLLQPGDLLVANDTRVIPARLMGKKPTGGAAEVLLLKREGPGLWEALVRSSKRAKEGTRVVLDDTTEVEVVGVRGQGKFTVRIVARGDPDEAVERLGRMPLPPYIRGGEAGDDDRDWYQTVFAHSDKSGSAAAPTAGLHFTPRVLNALEDRGVELAHVTLHVGLGTFQPVREQNVRDHVMHNEWYEVSQATAAQVNRALDEGRRVISVGTTATRTLEHSGRSGRVEAGTGWTDLFILPGYEFRVISGMVTNFHLPESTLIMLVSALGGVDEVLAAYRHAVAEGYRFYSYGDAMLVV